MPTPFAFEPPGRPPRRADRFALRFWSVAHSRVLERAYALLERTLVRLAPLAARLGLARLERPVTSIERGLKGALFDCRMCGQCLLSSTGMSCPMNCPKSLRNGPCGGVRANGNCEVHAEMPCVWVKAWEGSRDMAGGDAIKVPAPPIDHRLKGSSTWMTVIRAALPAAAETPKKKTGA